MSNTTSLYDKEDKDSWPEFDMKAILKYQNMVDEGKFLDDMTPTDTTIESLFTR